MRGLKEDAEVLQRRFYREIEAKKEAVLMLSTWAGFKILFLYCPSLIF